MLSLQHTKIQFSFVEKASQHQHVCSSWSTMRASSASAVVILSCVVPTLCLFFVFCLALLQFHLLKFILWISGSTHGIQRCRVCDALFRVLQVGICSYSEMEVINRNVGLWHCITHYPKFLANINFSCNDRLLQH